LTRPRDVEWEHHAHELHHAERSRFAEVEGVRLHYQEAGSPADPAMILIHGFTASTLVWSEVLVPMSERGFHVIAPDLAGFGFSGKPKTAEYTIDWQARLIMGLMDKLGIERATLVGNSYGGAVAAICALDYPERVKSLVLVGAVSNDNVKKRLLLRLGRSPVVGDLISPLLLDVRWLVRRRVLRNRVRIKEINEQRFETHHRHLRTSSTQRAALCMLRRWHAERIRDEAHLIKQPVLLIWGEQDVEMPLEDGHFLHRQIPGARLMVFRNCGHLPQEEYPQEFVELVTEFVSSE
ncbi:MAG: alpha/beta hydrolase, partial [Acidobacteria bacterium]|nr:alpha/beta hydrolase [Acidobacteriota bacterium]